MGRKPTKKLSFFKVLLCDFPDHLRIPRKFTKKRIRPSVGRWVLRSPSGQRYDVELEKRGDGWFIHDHGWHTFVKDHLLQYGDFLVFRYVGKEKFEVKVFDRTCCEKDFDHEVPKSRRGRPAAYEGNPAQVKAERAEEMGVEVAKRRNGGLIHAAPLANEGYRLALVKDERLLILKLKTTTETTLNLLTRGGVSGNNDLSRKPLRIQDGKKPSTKSIIFKSEYSCFKATLKDMCTVYRVSIPLDLAMTKGLMTEETIEVEDSTGRLWPAKLVSRTYTYNKSNKICNVAMSTGWGECRKANNIAIGDTVVFEFVQQSVLRLHIFRKRPGRKGGNNSRDYVVLDVPNTKKVITAG